MWATSIGLTFSQSPVPGRAEVGNPRGNRDAGAGERDHRAGRADQLGERVDAAAGTAVRASLTGP